MAAQLYTELNTPTLTKSPTAALSREECAHLADKVVKLSIDTLQRMWIPEKGLCCLQLTNQDTPLEYHPVYSWRYTVMCLLGIHRAKMVGIDLPPNFPPADSEVFAKGPSREAGDLGLLLWLSAKTRIEKAPEIAALLEQKLQKTDWHSMQGMEIGWVTIGAAHYTHATGQRLPVAEKVAEYLFTNRLSPSGLVYHLGKTFRRRFPNFATQIYSVYALAVWGRYMGQKRFLEAGNKLASKLNELQQPNGGWPWLYDAARGCVVEPFEVYSVHQHAMAPMALFELQEASGFDVRDMVVRSMSWLLSNNECSFPMIDYSKGLIWRSIRRKSPRDRVELWKRTLFAYLGSSCRKSEGTEGIEVQLNCRPYELGWLLEAWCRKSPLG